MVGTGPHLSELRRIAGNAPVRFAGYVDDRAEIAAAYAAAYLDPASPLFCDAVTASPYLGMGALEPLFATAEANAAGALGAKLTGGGLGGCIMALAPSGAHAEKIRDALYRAGAVHTWHTKVVP